MKGFKLFIVCIILSLITLLHNIPSAKTQTSPPKSCPTPSLIFNLLTSQDGKYLVANWEHNSVRVWDVETADIIATFTDDGIQYDDLIAISPDSKHILTGGKSGFAILWNIFESDPLLKFELTPPVRYITFLSNNKYLLMIGLKEVILWNIETQNEVFHLTVEDKVETIEQAQIGFNEKFLLTENRLVDDLGSSRVVIWDMNSGNELHSFEKDYRAFFFEDGKYILNRDSDGYHIWDAQSHKEIHLLHSPIGITSLGFSPDGKYLYGREKEAAILIFDVKADKQLYRFDTKASPIIVHFFPNSEKILVSKAWLNEQDWEAGGIYSIYDLKTGTEAYTIIIKDSPSSATNSLITPNGKYFIAASATSSEIAIRLWDIQTGKLLNQYC